MFSQVSSGFRAVRFSCMLGEFGLVSLVGWFLCVPPTSQSARVYGECVSFVFAFDVVELVLFFV